MKVSASPLSVSPAGRRVVAIAVLPILLLAWAAVGFRPAKATAAT